MSRSLGGRLFAGALQFMSSSIALALVVYGTINNEIVYVKCRIKVRK